MKLCLSCLLFLALFGCVPKLPPVDGCDPFVQRCVETADHRHYPGVCSADRRTHRIGDLTCEETRQVCSMLDGGRASCIPREAVTSADAGVEQ